MVGVCGSSRKLSVEHLVTFGAYSMKHDQIWIKHLGNDIYEADVKSDEN